MPLDEARLERAADVTALPRLLEGPRPLAGRIRVTPEDFRVVEELAYEAAGEGEHLYVRFEKTELTTPEAVRRIAAALDVDPRGSGWAGLKDRRAITEQWASFHRADPARLDRATIDGVRILEAKPHGHKLRTGHVRSNRFALVVRGEADVEATARALDELARRGVPNYFGEQRFGVGGSNLARAVRWLLEGGRPPRKKHERKLFVSTFQSALFNELLGARVAARELDAVVDGDLLRKEDSGGLFVTEDPAVDGPRAAAFELSATGPMFGARMRWPEGEAKAREEATLAAWGMRPEDLNAFRAAGPGTRRPYRAQLLDARAEAHPEGARIVMTLPAGVYATVVLRELLELPA